ncbi:hypothetical protein EMIT047CA2_70118 [Pseudomonas soli]
MDEQENAGWRDTAVDVLDDSAGRLRGTGTLGGPLCRPGAGPDDLRVRALITVKVQGSINH